MSPLVCVQAAPKMRPSPSRLLARAEPRLTLAGRRQVQAVGRRKDCVAQVTVRPGTGRVRVNGQEAGEYFPGLAARAGLLRPLVETGTLGKFDVDSRVRGGGRAQQAGAVRHGIARALNEMNTVVFRPGLKASGLLTRDPRVVERKKPGKPKARKSFQWVKR